MLNGLTNHASLGKGKQSLISIDYLMALNWEREKNVPWHNGSHLIRKKKSKYHHIVIRKRNMGYIDTLYSKRTNTFPSHRHFIYDVCKR